MINPTTDTILLFLLLIVAVALWWYAKVVDEEYNKSRYVILVWLGNVVLTLGIAHFDIAERTTLHWPFIVWSAASILHYLYCGFVTIDYIATSWADRDEWWNWAERLAAKVHGRKDAE